MLILFRHVLHAAIVGCDRGCWDCQSLAAAGSSHQTVNKLALGMHVVVGDMGERAAGAEGAA